MENNVLYRTIHGSRLYGLERVDSDWDYYTVVADAKKKKPTYHTHSIVDGVDSQVVDLSTWMLDCAKGVPQALEAMFSQKAEYDELAEFRAAYRAGRDYDIYFGIMKRIALTPKYDTLKHRRHVLRLGWCVSELSKNDRFNPTLTPDRVQYFNDMAHTLSMEWCL